MRSRKFITTYATVAVSAAVTLAHLSLRWTDTVAAVAVIGKTSLRLYSFHRSSVPDRLLNTDPTAVVAPPPPTHSNKQIEVVTTLFKVMAAILVRTYTFKKTVNEISVFIPGKFFVYLLLDAAGYVRRLVFLCSISWSSIFLDTCTLPFCLCAS